jgi:hypothetical protein
MIDPSKGHIKLTRVSIESLKPADYNPRMMTDKARQGLSNSIDTFGLLQPIVWNKQTGNVVGGHQRLYDLIQKGVTETDVIMVDFPLSKEKAANIALNHTGISGMYDDTKLQELLNELENVYLEDLNLDELKVPEWQPLPEVTKEQFDEVNFDKIIVKVHDTAFTSEVKDTVKRILMDHFTEDQVSIA